MVRKILLAAFILVFSLVFMQSALYADGSKSYKHSGLEEKFYKQGHKILENNKELGLSEDQIKQVKALKKQVKKDLIQQDADIKTLEVEVNTLMWEAPIDVNQTNALVEEKYELKKKKAKYLVSAYDKLNKILTKEQLKELGKTF